jgi:hypothetical protein
MATKVRYFANRLLDGLAAADANRLNQGRILRAVKRIKALEATTYQENDLRGLSKPEKEFIRENEYKCWYDCNDVMGRRHRYYIFMAKDLTTGRKRIYAYRKDQYIQLNGHDISSDAYNYECWLIVDLRKGYGEISRHRYERRFSNILAPVAIF